MRARGMRVSWVIVVTASLFISGHLLRHGQAAYSRAPAANPKPSPVQETPPPAEPQAAPRLRWEQPEFDFGSLYQGQKVTHEFAFRNVGKAPLKIETVKASCGCTTVSRPEAPVPPGQKGSVKIVFDAGRMRGPVVKHVYVTSNDEVEGRSTLTIKGLVKFDVEVVPSGVYFGSIEVGQITARPVLIKPAEVKRFRILRVKPEHPLVMAGKPTLSRPPDPEGAYRLILTVGPAAAPAQISTRVVVTTDLPHQRELVIPVYGRVVAELPRPPEPPRQP